MTQGKEIENYTPVEIWESYCGKKLGSINEYDSIPEKLAAALGKKTISKVEIASEVIKNLTVEAISDHLDLAKKMKELVFQIEKWNKVKS